MIINGIKVTATEFAFEGCHKFYLIENDAERKSALELDYDIYPIEKLPELFQGSCPLRFIHPWNLEGDFDDIVPQFTNPVTFIDDNGNVTVCDFPEEDNGGLL